LKSSDDFKESEYKGLSAVISSLFHMKKYWQVGDSKTGLRKVVCRMPKEPLGGSKYLTRGCRRTENDPSTACIECDWEGDLIEGTSNAETR